MDKQSQLPVWQKSSIYPCPSFLALKKPKGNRWGRVTRKQVNGIIILPVMWYGGGTRFAEDLSELMITGWGLGGVRAG